MTTHTTTAEQDTTVPQASIEAARIALRARGVKLSRKHIAAALEAVQAAEAKI